MSNTKESCAWILASGAYLTESLPSNWEKLNESELHKFIQDHLWEPFEYYPADDVFEFIDNLALCIERDRKANKELATVFTATK
tara:strand:- start:639 stop:890 length:252 start_codon:yes stop_codon:yes gene_type:complete